MPVALVLALSLCFITPLPAAAQSVTDYFQISYEPVVFSKNEISGDDVFYATIIGSATCVNDLPVPVSEATITSRVIAKHKLTGTRVILNSSITVTINPFSSKKGETKKMKQVVSLQFPARAESGDYNIFGEPTEAKVKTLLLWLNVTKYLPKEQQMGSLKHIAQAPKPDLIVQDISWPPTNPKTGDSITFTITIKNQGGAKAGYSTVKYYFDGNYYTSDSVSSLSAGSTTRETFTWAAKEGLHSIKAVADAYASVPESNDTNNEKVETITVAPPPEPDLIVQDISWSPTNPTAEDSITFTVTIKNQGEASAGYSTVKYYLDGNYYTSGSVSSLSVDSTAKGTFSWTAAVGSHTINAIADADNRVSESNDNNNTKSKTVNISESYGNLSITITDFETQVPLMGVAVYLDDNPPVKTDPVGKLEIPVSKKHKHNIRTEIPDYYAATREFEIPYGNSGKDLLIELKTSLVEVLFKVIDDKEYPAVNIPVFIDGVKVGVTDIKGELVATVTENNQYEVKVDEDLSYRKYESVINVGDDTEDFVIRLEKRNKDRPNIMIRDLKPEGDSDDTIEDGEIVIITYSVDDEDGIQRIECILNDKVIDSYFREGTYTTRTDSLPIGDYILKIIAIDADDDSEESIKETGFSVLPHQPYVDLYGTKTTVIVGEEIVLELSAVNPITSPGRMTVQLTLRIPSGWSITSSGFTHGAGGLRTSSIYEIEQGPNPRVIWVHIMPNEPYEGKIIGVMDYYFTDYYFTEGDKRHKEKTLEVKATIPKEIVDDEDGNGNTPYWWIVLATVVLGGIAITVAVRRRSEISLRVFNVVKRLRTQKNIRSADEKESFGVRLRELREQAGLSQAQLAGKVGVNFTYLSRIESGAKPPPSEKVILRLAKVLNADKDELLTLAGKMPADIA
ncbi:CARDB domain-containing protein [Chloroflexota bacterium]